MTDPVAGLREGLRDRYAFERELGRGGMATVWLAQDLKHDRPVALKMLHPELAASLGPERFQREIKLAARLQHPHVLTVLDSGETAGRLWFTMPFVEGESLRERLRRERQLPADAALRIATEAARGLEYAHQHGIVHRDIKPENILLTRDGSTLVADFGIARALSASGDEKLTETGVAVGTPAYMSPEQAAGDRDLDARTDIYSLAAVLFEMLAGEPPYTGATTQALMVKRLTEPAPSVRAVRPNLPEAVDGAIRKALSPVPADRFATMTELAAALGTVERRYDGTTEREIKGATTTVVSGPRSAVPPFRRSAAILLLGFVLGLGVLFGWLRRHNTAAGATPGHERRLAVLPFENLGAKDDEYFADGMTDEVRGKLAALHGLEVIAHRSAAEYKGSSKTYEEIGRELGVDYLLVGKVRWDKAAGGQSRVRVSPELIEVAGSRSRWQQPFDAVLSDVFQVQGRIAGEVARALDVALAAPEREQLETKPTRNLAAYDAFLRGEEISKRMTEADPATMDRAISSYERAVALDSGFVQAWVRLSQAQSVAWTNGIPSPERAARARQAAEQALALDPDAAGGRLALGTYLDYIGGDYEKALEQFALGQRADPNNADLLSGAALSEQSLGRWDDALKHLRRAEALDPRSATTADRLARTLNWLRQHQEAEAVADRSLALEPSSAPAFQAKVMARLGRGDLEGARAALRAVPEQIDPTTLVSNLGVYWDMGWVLTDEQQALLLRLTPAAFGDDRFNWAHVRSQVYGWRGDAARSRAYADSAIQASNDVLGSQPDDAQRRILLGVALAYAGRKAEAVREAERGYALKPISRDAYGGPYNLHQLMRVYILTGNYEKALDRLEELLRIPYFLSPGWLLVDPTFDPLREQPRFRKLAGGS
ncbi:MAG TPA: protein kinase [Gemmatimonadales bacterium]|nr:protein kinase [Gemmatimonadales bacterium]